MWLTGDSEIVSTDVVDETKGTKAWLADTLKSAAATSAAVIMAAGISRIQDYVINIGVPQQHRLGAPGNPGLPQTASSSSTPNANKSFRSSLLAAY